MCERLVRKDDVGVRREVHKGIKSWRLAHVNEVNEVTHRRAKGEGRTHKVVF